MKKRIAILGSTGSIGTQALEVIKANPNHFEVEVLVANNNASLLIEQAKQYNPNCIVIANEALYNQVKSALSGLPIKIYTGEKAISQVVENENIDLVLTAMVGFAGLEPTISAIRSGKIIALANKETLVVAGELIMSLAKKNQSAIIPVDSEHSAIFQCLSGEYHPSIEKIILTASGGPFRNKTIEQLSTVTKTEALKHPNWNMGNKVTIDSATLMNKGLEMIEARWLFGLKPEQIEIIIHPQSIIHSLVQFVDGSIKAQMGLPDMKLPIQYALSFPQRLTSSFERFSFSTYPNLSFEAPDFKKFRNLQLAYDAIQKCGNMPCIMNAANEIAVEAFLQEKITFNQIPDIIFKTMNSVPYQKNADLSCFIETNREARKKAQEYIP